VEPCLHSYSYGVHKETELCSTSIKFRKHACIKSGISGRTEFRFWKRLTCSPVDCFYVLFTVYTPRKMKVPMTCDTSTVSFDEPFLK
jgi:hypothetical protein